MTTVPFPQTMTAEEFIEMPVPEHGRPWNLVEGEVVVNQPTPLHVLVQTKLILAIGAWTQAGTGRGKIILGLDVHIDDRNVYAPDVLWYAEGRAPGRHSRPPSPMPDLAAEVRSPSTWRYDVGLKKSGYECAGLRELWLVDTAADEVIVFRRSSADAPSFDVARVGTFLEFLAEEPSWTAQARCGLPSPLPANDAWVAACCLTHVVPLATLNPRDYDRIEDLRLVPS